MKGLENKYWLVDFLSMCVCIPIFVFAFALDIVLSATGFYPDRDE